MTALIGPTGSGKTTLLRTLNRMNDKVAGYRHAGDVRLGGRSIWHPAVELMSLRRRVGMLFQRPNPFPMSIMENVVAGARAHRLAGRKDLKEIARHRLAEVGLWDAVAGRLNDSPFRLSGGQQQLLCLARALTVNPEVLLLDKPHVLAGPGYGRVSRGADQEPDSVADHRDRDTQPGAGTARLGPDHVLVSGPPRRARPHDPGIREPGTRGNRPLRRWPVRVSFWHRNSRAHSEGQLHVLPGEIHRPDSVTGPGSSAR